MANHLTEEFIQKQKQRLLDLKKKVTSEIEELKKDDPFSDPDHAVDNAAVDNDVREQTGHQIIEAQIKELQIRLENVEIALGKIERGSYGIDEKTNQPIPLARLELIPEARAAVVRE